MAAFLDVCRFNPTAGSTTDWTYSSAVTGYQSPSAAGVVNGRLYKYRAESADLLQWEVGEGAYNTGTGVLARTTVLFNSSGTTSKINFSAAPQVAIVALKEDLISVEEANSFSTAQKSQARTNIDAQQTITRYSATLTADVTPTISTVTDVLSLSNPTGAGSGTFRVQAKASFKDTGGAGKAFFRLSDTSTVFDASGYISTSAANTYAEAICIGYITDPVGAIKLQMFNPTSSTGKAVCNDTGAGNLETRLYAEKVG